MYLICFIGGAGVLQTCPHPRFLIYFPNLNRCTKSVGMMYIVCAVTALRVPLYKIQYKLQTRLQPTVLLLGRRINPSAIVLDQLDQGVSGTFHGNAALHNGLQKEIRCTVLGF